MPALRGLTVSVGYSETLRICLVRNMRHFTDCWVVTSPEDVATQEVVLSVPGAHLSIASDFTSHGAKFNKGLALERAGFELMGRHGWIVLHDADILFPDTLPLDQLKPGHLYGARRRILEDPSTWTPSLDWNTCPLSRDGGPIGFTQIFESSDPAIKDKRPWYDVSFTHAGGGDAYFITHWPREKLKVLPFDVLHLGQTDMNWFGTDPGSRDKMAKFVTANGWKRAAAKFSPEQVARAGEVVERVTVPGYPPSTYELPFVRRAREAREAAGA